MTIKENIAARKAHTTLLLAPFDKPILSVLLPETNHAEKLAAPPVVKRLTGVEAEKALFGWVYKQPGMATFDDCKDILKRVYHERGPDEAKSLMQRFGIAEQGIKALFAGLHDRFFDYAATSLYYGVSPAHGWSSLADIQVHDVPRDRWLLWHRTGNTIWEVRGALSGELDDRNVTDVSGVPKFEKWYVEKQTKAGADEEL